MAMPTTAAQPARAARPPAPHRLTDSPTRREALAGIAAAMVAALAVVAPFFFLGNAAGHDFDFHVTSWMEAAQQWREGVLYPRWAAWANYGFGEPRFIFYPPVSWVLGAALGCVLPWKAVPGALVWLALTLAGAAMFRLGREWMPAGQATGAALLYAVNPYHLFVIYVRSAHAELLASALFPLVVLCALRCVGGKDAGQHTPGNSREQSSANAVILVQARSVVPLALVFAAIWLVSAPAAVIVTYGLVLLLAVLAVVHRSAKPLLSGAAAMALGLLLAAFYVVPAAWEQRWVNIAEALASELRPEHNFLFTTANDPSFSAVNRLVSWIAVTQLALTGVAAVAAAPWRHKARELWWVALALAIAAAALMLPVTSPAWRWLPELRFVQFPWRWLFPLSVAFALFLAAVIAQARARLACSTLLAAVLIAAGSYIARRAWWDSEDIPRMQAAMAQGTGYEGNDEYAPRGADRYDLPQSAPRVAILPADEEESSVGASALVRVQVERWEAEAKACAVEARAPVRLAFRLLNYPAWQVKVDGKVVAAGSQEHTGQVIVPVPAGRSRIELRFTRTRDRTAGAALTALAAVVLTGLALAPRHGAGAHQRRSSAG